jgi:hypothetical protein
VYSTSSYAVYDYSDYFSLISGYTGQVTVTAPNGGESWVRGTTRNVTWTSTNVNENVKITLHEGTSGTIYDTIVESTANDGSYSWPIPSSGLVGNIFRVRISPVNHWGTGYDYSNSNFELRSDFNGQVTVTSPNGGESWVRGTTRNVTWTSTNVNENVKITLHEGTSGTIYDTIVESTANDGSYSWPIPSSGLVGNIFRVRISPVNHWGTGYDYSDNNFALTTDVPTTIDADLSNVYVTPNPVVLGETLTVHYTLTNTGTVSHTFTVGGQIWDSTYKGTLPTKQHTLSVSQSVSSTITCTIETSWPPGNYEVRLRVWSSSGELLDEEPPPQFKVIAVPPPHAVTPPSTPTGGPAGGSGFSETSYTFSTGAASCNQSHSVQYRFDWGDGSYSGWSSSSSASHEWHCRPQPLYGPEVTSS